jgi:hypothetical protein
MARRDRFTTGRICDCIRLSSPPRSIGQPQHRCKSLSHQVGGAFRDSASRHVARKCHFGRSGSDRKAVRRAIAKCLAELWALRSRRRKVTSDKCTPDTGLRIRHAHIVARGLALAPMDVHESLADAEHAWAEKHPAGDTRYRLFRVILPCSAVRALAVGVRPDTRGGAIPRSRSATRRVRSCPGEGHFALFAAPGGEREAFANVLGVR